jgi:UDP-glucose 4-epimerase
MRVLVTGGAGYIGSHTCVELLEAGHEVFVIDNLSNGHEAALEQVRNITKCNLGFMNANIHDSDALDKIFNSFRPEAVIHFAGLKSVAESVEEPVLYYDVNVGGSIVLLKAMTRWECYKIVFSSSATVYGNPEYLPYDELHPTNPVNPYGQTKLMIEKIISDWVAINKRNIGTILRYFNPVGAHVSGCIGEAPSGTPNNLMPYIAQVAIGKRDCLKIFGDKYETKDGTGLRDYIHVVDLADAHLRTVELQSQLNSFELLNIGSGVGFTVLEIVRSFEKMSGNIINFNIVDSRPGDLPAFWANSTRALKLIGWEPTLQIDRMCEDTWRWQLNNPDGYK